MKVEDYDDDLPINNLKGGVKTKINNKKKNKSKTINIIYTSKHVRIQMEKMDKT